MFSSCIYAFSLAIAILAVGGYAFKVSPPPVCSVEESSSDYNYYEERYNGKYTGPWVADTLACFDRVHAVIEHNSHGHTERFINFSETTPTVEPNSACDINYSIGYARDFMNRTGSMKNKPLSNDYNTYYLNSSSCTERKDDQFYPLNKESVWQIPIPKNLITYVVFSVFDLEKAQRGSCINDFVSVYADDQLLGKYCGSLTSFTMLIPAGPERLTIRFQSNEANNLGGFSGAVWFYSADQPKTKRDVSRAQAEEYIAVEEYEYIAVEEVDSSNEDEIEQALACLADIAEHGESAAAKYLESAPNAECKRMAEAFFH